MSSDVLPSFDLDAEIDLCEEYETEKLIRLSDTVALSRLIRRPDLVAVIVNAVVEVGVSEDVIRLTRNTTA